MKESETKLTAYWLKYKINSINNYPHIKCSNCEQYWSISEQANIFKYCFNCGAKILGVKDLGVIMKAGDIP